MTECEQWQKRVDFQVSGQFVQPLVPASGQSVHMGIRIPEASPVCSVVLVALVQGRVCSHEMKPAHGLWTCSLSMPDTEGLVWWFELHTPITVYYYSREGFSPFVPPLRECFVLLSDLALPSWIADGVCYQIFPDRFRSSDPSVGVQPGSYEFDGAKPQVLTWGETPLEFEQGKCLDFYNGDLQGIADSVQHFMELGVTVLYLNPIGVSKTIHRYDCCDFFHVDENLGGDDALVHLIDVMHEHGIKVVVDISINHTGTSHPWFVAAQENPEGQEAKYYYRKEDGSFVYWENVPTLPQLNYGNDELRDLMYRSEGSVLKKFLKAPFHQDGWRLDVADVVGRYGKDQFCHEIWREVRKSVKGVNPQAYLVAEDWGDASDHLQGDQWDATMNYYGSSRPLRRWVGETDRYQLPGWGHDPVPGPFFSGLDFAKALDRQLKSLPPQMLFQQFNLIDSHDTPRLHNNHHIHDWNLYRGAVMFMYMLPGMPNIYYGDEIGLEGRIGSMEAARYSMQWDRSRWHMEYWNLYKELGKLRRTEPALAFGAWRILFCDQWSVVFARYDGNRAVIMVLNKAMESRKISFDASVLSLKAIRRWSGCQAVSVSFDGTVSLEVEATESEILIADQEY